MRNLAQACRRRADGDAADGRHDRRGYRAGARVQSAGEVCCPCRGDAGGVAPAAGGRLHQGNQFQGGRYRQGGRRAVRPGRRALPCRQEPADGRSGGGQGRTASRRPAISASRERRRARTVAAGARQRRSAGGNGQGAGAAGGGQSDRGGVRPQEDPRLRAHFRTDRQVERARGRLRGAESGGAGPDRPGGPDPRQFPVAGPALRALAPAPEAGRNVRTAHAHHPGGRVRIRVSGGVRFRRQRDEPGDGLHHAAAQIPQSRPDARAQQFRDAVVRQAQSAQVSVRAAVGHFRSPGRGSGRVRGGRRGTRPRHAGFRFAFARRLHAGREGSRSRPAVRDGRNAQADRRRQGG